MKLKVFFMAVTAMLAMSCGRGENAESKEASDSTATTLDQLNRQADTSRNPELNTALQTEEVPAQTPPPDWDQKLIKNASLNLELHNYDSFDLALHQQLKTFGAYISAEKQTRGAGIIQNDVTIKVPVYQFENLMACFNGKGIIIKDREISAQDVTADITDQKARNETKKRVRERYMELMGNAKKMKDVLTIQEELNNLQQNIESNTGQINSLEHQAAYSNIHLIYYQPMALTEENTNNEPGFGRQLIKAFTSGADVVRQVILFFITIWPLTIAGIISLVWYKKKRDGWKTQKSA